jgi:hypothetical protein
MRVSSVTFIEGRNGRTPTTPKYAIAIHNTSNKGTARNEASYATRREDGIGSHFYADRIETLQSVDTSKYVWHAGSSAGNHNAIAVEIVGTNDKSRQWWLDNVNWQQLGQTLATLAHEYDIPVRRCSVAEMRANPKIKGFYSHNDMRQAWGGTSHDDPGPNFPWDVLFNYINTALGHKPTPVPITPIDLWESDMQMLVKGFAPDPNQVWLVDGMRRRKVKAEWVGEKGNGPITNSQVHQAGFLGNLAHNGEVYVSGGDIDVWGIEVKGEGV